MDGDDRSIARFTALSHATFHGYELSIPVFVVVWLDTFSVTAATLGLVLAAGFALVGIGGPPCGVLADRYGSKRLVLCSIGGMGLSFALIALSPNVLVLTFALVVWGAAASLYHPAGLSLISRGAEARGTVLGYHGAAGSVGTALGPSLALGLLVVLDWRSVAFAFVLPALFAVALGLWIDVGEGDVREGDAGTTEATADGGHVRSFLDSSRSLLTGSFLVVFAVVMTYGIYYRGLTSFLPDVLSRLAIAEPVAVGGGTIDPAQAVYVGLLLVGVLGQYAGGRLTDRVASIERALVATFLVLALASLAFVPAAGMGIVALAAVCAVIGFAMYVFAPMGQALIAETVPADLHGLSYGYTYFGTFGVGALGASLAGATLTYATWPALFGLLTAVAVVCAAIAGWLAVRQ
ncbi:MFS transporter [Natronorarus salvus]|uniref:MFS transporter n=1 Tax=Natronorarus salvus TaxID=3117733 RepID=UPI002F26A93A